MGKKQQHADQEIFIGPLPRGAGRQEVHVNPPGASSTPRYAGGTERLGLFTLLLVLIIGGTVLIGACGVASALVTGSIW